MDEPERLTRQQLIRRVCRRVELADGGHAVNFTVKRGPREVPAFVVAFRGEVHAYANVCPHRWTSLDWQPGEVFDETGLYLICATHGALFEPDSGRCIAGPCHGASLEKIPVRHEGEHVVLEHDVLANFTEG